MVIIGNRRQHLGALFLFVMCPQYLFEIIDLIGTSTREAHPSAVEKKAKAVYIGSICIQVFR